MNKETKQQIRLLKKEMKLNNIRVISCFNAGLSPSEQAYNTKLFELKTRLENGK